jgi:hypothetical protein
MSNAGIWTGQKGRVFRRILFEVTVPGVCGILWGALALSPTTKAGHGRS